MKKIKKIITKRKARSEAATVRISGATGKIASYVNGLFELTDEKTGPVWKMRGNGQYLYRAHDGRWFVSHLADKDARKSAGYAHSEDFLGPDSLPTDARAWKVHVGDGKWEAQALRVRSRGGLATGIALYMCRVVGVQTSCDTSTAGWFPLRTCAFFLGYA